MNWREIEVVCDRYLEEEIYAILYQFPITSIEIEDDQDIINFKNNQPYWVVLEDNEKEYREDIIIRTYLEETKESEKNICDLQKLLKSLKKDHPNSLEFSIERIVEDRDWSEEWKKGYKPFKVSDSLVIKPTWEEYSQKKDEIIINIDPGMAFGTGTHETTSLSLEELSAADLKDKTVFDIGCGSGILSIAAILLGAKSAYAVDIDPLAIKATKENAVVNKVDKQLTAEIRDIISDQATGEKYDVVVSNTLYIVLVSLVPKLRDYLKGRGLFLCSGLLKTQKEDMEDCLRKHGFKILGIREDGEWISISAENRNV